ncbi:MAG: Rrf2 family transcriptional regulator [Elusimicrobia bacterium]|nr:Rrf2 family transcriptional regulator [Elusimicrobiota bacterium]
MNPDVRLIGVSKSSRYAILGLVHLASSRNGDRVLAEDAAKTLSLPRSYLAKLFQRLAHKGLLASQRGPHGGYALARPAGKITLAEVIEATQEPRAGERECLLEPRRCTGTGVCAMHEHVLAAERHMLDSLSKITLAQAAGLDSKEEKDAA